MDDDSVVSNADTFKVQIMQYPPKFKILPRDTIVSIYDTISLNCLATDTNGTVIKYFWTNLRTNRYDTTSTGTLRTAFQNPGDYNIIVQAMDDDSVKTSADTITVNVATLAPSIQAIRDTLMNLHDTLLLVVKGTASPGRTIKRYLWKVESPALHDTTIASERKFHFADTGTYVITIMAQDDHGINSLPCTTTVRDTAITPKTSAGKDTTLNLRATLELKGTATDDGTISEYAWQFPGSSTWKVVSNGDTTITLPDSAGTYQFKFRAKDNDGFYGVAILNITLKSSQTLWDEFKWDVDAWQ
jgi:hypothetical protein